jgi:hypothetical protein
MKKINMLLVIGIIAVIIASGCVSETGEMTKKPDTSTTTPAETKTCPSSCNDGNACTEDHCSEATNYECKHDLKISCCGNTICESGETYTTCTSDCKCASNWQCRAWSECSLQGTQTRTCTDLNNCGVVAGKPIETQTCTPPIQELITKSPSEMLPTANELPTEFSIGEIEDITKESPVLKTRNAVGFESGKGLSIDKYKIVGSSFYDAVLVQFGIYKFSSTNHADSFFDTVVDEVKSEGGYTKLSFSTPHAGCFTWKIDHGFEVKFGESICQRKNVIFWTSVTMQNTYKQPDDYVKDMANIVDKKVYYADILA